MSSIAIPHLPVPPTATSTGIAQVCHIGQVVIMEACPMTRAGLRRLLTHSDFLAWNILQTSTLQELPGLVASPRTELVLMDVSDEGGSVLQGLQVISHLLADYPLLSFVVCTNQDDPRILKQLMAAGVGGIYFKQEPLAVLSRRILDVMEKYPRGERSLRQACKNTLLTQREIDVLKHLFTGKSVTHTALALHRDIRTVSTHKRNAMMKLEFHNDCEFYSWGARLAHREAWL